MLKLPCIQIFMLLSVLLSGGTASAACKEEDFYVLQNELESKIEKLEEVTYVYDDGDAVDGEVETQRVTRDLLSISYRTKRIKGAFIIGFDVLPGKIYIANYMEGAGFQKRYVAHSDIKWCEKVILFPSGNLMIELQFMDDLSISLINSTGETMGRWLFH